MCKTITHLPLTDIPALSAYMRKILRPDHSVKDLIREVGHRDDALHEEVDPRDDVESQGEYCVQPEKYDREQGAEDGDGDSGDAPHEHLGAGCDGWVPRQQVDAAVHGAGDDQAQQGRP